MNEKADLYKHFENQLIVLIKDHSARQPAETLEHLGQMLEFAAKLYDLAPEVASERWTRIQNDYPLGKRTKHFNQATKLMQERSRFLTHLIEETKHSMCLISLHSNQSGED